MKHYLDYNATAPVRPEVVAIMQELLSQPLNASSIHAQGRRARGIIESARRTIAEMVGAFDNEIVFTSSGTEANNWVLRALKGLPLIVSGVEHSSVYKTAHVIGNPIVLPTTCDGIVDMDNLDEFLPEDEPFLLSLMLANNETGVIQPVREMADEVHVRGGLLHCDAVQAFGKMPLDFTALNCDLMTVAGHKMGGPVGAAALVVKNDLTFAPMLTGGGQELNRRAGTESVAAIAGFAQAASLADFDHMRRINDWLGQMEKEVQIAAKGRAVIMGKNVMRLPNTSCIAMPGVPADTQLIWFDLEGIAVSAGSACSSGRIEPSHVLRAIGVEEGIASAALRISGGWATSQADLEAFCDKWKKLYFSRTLSE